MSAVGQPSISSRPLHSPSQVIEETALGSVTSPPRDIPPSFTSSSSSLAGPGALERLALTRRAPHMMRLHLVRSAIRVTVLMTGDAGALLLLRVLLKGVRDEGWWGSAAAGLMAELVPAGALPLVQLLPAVLLGLIALDTYGASDRRRDSGRLVAGASLGLGLPFWAYLWSHFTPLAVPGFIVLATVIGTALIAERHLIDHVVRKLWPIGPGAARALLIGRPEHTKRALEHPILSDAREFAFGAILDPEEFGRQAGKRGFSRLCQTMKRYRADTVVLSGPLDDDAL
jgi:hypothetical protein